DGERHPGKARYELPVSGRGTRREILKGLHQKSIRQGYAPPNRQRVSTPSREKRVLGPQGFVGDLGMSIQPGSRLACAFTRSAMVVSHLRFWLSDLRAVVPPYHELTKSLILQQVSPRSGSGAVWDDGG